MSILNFNSFSAQQGVSVTYKDMPSNTKIVFVNRTSATPQSGGIKVSGSGTVAIPVTGLVPGDYYLQAQDAAGHWLAQTVVFYI